MDPQTEVEKKIVIAAIKYGVQILKKQHAAKKTQRRQLNTNKQTKRGRRWL